MNFAHRQLSSSISGNTSHSSGSKLQCVLCGLWKMPRPTQPFTPAYADSGIGQVPKNSAIETTAVSLHKRQLCNRITTTKKHKTLLICRHKALLLLMMSALSSPVTEIIWPKCGHFFTYSIVVPPIWNSGKPRGSFNLGPMYIHLDFLALKAMCKSSA